MPPDREGAEIANDAVPLRVSPLGNRNGVHDAEAKVAAPDRATIPSR